jgi:hypothetical protein
MLIAYIVNEEGPIKPIERHRLANAGICGVPAVRLEIGR